MTKPVFAGCGVGAYYNDNEPYCAGWLRNLTAAGVLPAGLVDDRSILAVAPDDLAPYRHVHLFAGIGGWAYALGLAGWPDDRDVWTLSCPCQPLSSAGNRRAEADERHLWPAVYRLIAECRPATLIGEQVASRLGREWFCGVRADLEHLGYAVGGADLPAASVGAPHQRQRLFWCAYMHGAGPARERQSGRPDQAIIERSMAEVFKIRDRRFSELVAMDVAQRSPSYAEAVRLVDGIPGGVGQLRAFGNAIVPQVAAVFIRAVM